MTLPIFVIDDDPMFLDAARESIALVAPQFVMHAASSGAEALRLLRQAGGSFPRPSFVVIDYRLGDGDAPHVIAEMRNLDALEGVPVLVLSQFAWQHDVEAAVAAGAVQYSVKPSSIRDLGALLERFWKEHGR